MHDATDVQQRAAGADELLAGGLAGAVRELSRKEEEQWRIGDPALLSMRWHPAEQDLFDYWENIQDSPQRPDPTSLSGQFTAIRETFEATGSQRLLVLGRAGAGKTVLAHRLILDLLDHRDPRGPVPVLFSLNDWNPTTTGLREWMANRLVRDHPFLEQHDATGKRNAELLVDRDWILPVLDGFDELPEQHHRAAISEINRVQWPLVVTSRPSEYAHAARDVNAVGRAVAIELEDLTLEQAEQYLRPSTNPSHAAEWETVFEHLRTAPQQAASQNLTSAVSTPLMVTLARATYNDTNERSPDELLDITRFPTSTDLEQHLLRGYVDTIYAPGHSTPSGVALPAGDPGEVRHWLGFLATGLSDRNTHELTWWQLPTLLRRRTRLLTTTITYGLAFAFALAFALGIAFGIDTGFDSGLVFVRAFVFGLAPGFMAGLVLGLVNEAGFARGRAGREPERLRPSWRRRGQQPRRSKRAFPTRAAVEFTNGLALGIVLGLTGWLASRLASWLAGWLADGVPLAEGFGAGLADELALGFAFGIVLGFAFGIANIVVSVLGGSQHPNSNDPWQLLTTDRRVTLIRTISAVLVIMIGIGLISYPHLTGLGWALLPLICVPFVGLPRLAGSAWASWLLFARLWLPLTGRLPWRPKRFLEDAHARGIFRQVGAAYQFRHAQLRDHLADEHRKPRKVHPSGSTAPPQ